MTDNPEPKRGPGGPVEKQMPELTPDTPANILRAVLNTPLKRDDEWRHLRVPD